MLPAPNCILTAVLLFLISILVNYYYLPITSYYVKVLLHTAAKTGFLNHHLDSGIFVFRSLQFSFEACFNKVLYLLLFHSLAPGLQQMAKQVHTIYKHFNWVLRAHAYGSAFHSSIALNSSKHLWYVWICFLPRIIHLHCKYLSV